MRQRQDRYHVRIVAAVVAVLLSGACQSPSKPKETTPVFTASQSLSRVMELIDSSVAVLTPKPRAERRPSAALDYTECLDPTDGGSERRVVVSRSYWLRGLPKTTFPSIGAQLRTEWIRQGLKITTDQDVETGDPSLAAEDAKTGFQIRVDLGGQGDLLVTAGSPCIWPDGTPGHIYVNKNDYPVPPGTPGAILKNVPVS